MTNSMKVKGQASTRDPRLREKGREKAQPTRDVSPQVGKWCIQDADKELCVLNSVIGTFLVAVVYVWIGNSVGSAMGAARQTMDALINLPVFALMARVCLPLVAPNLLRWLPSRPT